jgi:NAD(P)H-dependent flavin oxidoreductase YrpB (nitropropane dioxygenase family)
MAIDVRERLRLDVPILQAGMAGGLATAELAAAVSSAGALGTVGLVGPKRFNDEIRSAAASSRAVALSPSTC